MPNSSPKFFINIPASFATAPASVAGLDFSTGLQTAGCVAAVADVSSCQSLG